jgi:hypothetical protein
MLFGIIGFAYFTYGRKQAALVPLLAGIALMVFPYFIPNIYMLVLIGVILMALPFFIRP